MQVAIHYENRTDLANTVNNNRTIESDTSFRRFPDAAFAFTDGVRVGGFPNFFQVSTEITLMSDAVSNCKLTYTPFNTTGTNHLRPRIISTDTVTVFVSTVMR